MRTRQLLFIAGVLLMAAGCYLIFHYNRPDTSPAEMVQESMVRPAAQVPSASLNDGLSAKEQAPALEDAEDSADHRAGHPGWPGSQITSVQQAPLGGEPEKIRRVTLVEPADLPYPVRIEEIWLTGPDGTGEQLIERIEMAANRFLVKVDPSNSGELEEWASNNGFTLMRIGSSGLHRIETSQPEEEWVPLAMSSLRQSGVTINYTEPDYILRPLLSPDDPNYLDGSLWGMHNTGQDDGHADADIDAPEGWEIRTDASAIVVGVIDTGVRYTHEDIAANMWVNPGESGVDGLGNPKETNGVDDDKNGFIDDIHGIDAVNMSGDPLDMHGHGTHVAGTIAAVGNNGIAVTGVAWKARIMALRFIEGSGGSVSDAVTCIDYAITHGARITSNSWGGGKFSEALLDAIREARNAGQLFVVAASNSSEDNDLVQVYPTNFEVENILSVAAVNRLDELSDFSNYGLGSVEVGAPGESILSLDGLSDSGTVTMSGTSMATPMVSGVAALLMAEFPEADFMGIKNRIMKSVRPIPALAETTVSGGVVNLLQALETQDDRPGNDDFSESHRMLAEVGTIRSHNWHATTEAGEPLHAGEAGGSIWFTYEATTDGKIIVNTLGSDIDTVVAVYEGDLVDGLVEVGFNDDYVEGQGYSRFDFQGSAGEIYHAAVAGKDNETGYIRFSMSGPPREDFIAQAADMGLFPFHYSQDNSNASRDEDEPQHAGNPGGGSLWLKFVPNAGSKMVIRTRHSDIDTVLAVYTSTVANPRYDELVLVAENDDGPYGDTWSEVSFQAIPGQHYWVAVDGKDDARGRISLAAVRKISYDDFEDAKVISGNLHEIMVPFRDVNYSTREFGEPNHDNAGGTGSLWWEWTPATAGDFVIRTNNNTALGVYTGESVDALSLAAADQNYGSGNSYVVLRGAVPGVPYHIAFSRRESELILDDFIMSIEPYVAISNDMLANAMDITGAPTFANPFTQEFSSTVASNQMGEGPSQFELRGTAWYRWSPSESGDYIVTGNGSPARNVGLVIYTLTGLTADGLSFRDLSYVTHDDFSGQEFRPWIRMRFNAGTTYYIQAGSIGESSRGEILFSFYKFEPPANDLLTGATPLTGLFVQREYYNSGATREPGEPGHATTNWYYNGFRPFEVSPGSGTGYYVSSDLFQLNGTIWFKWKATEAELGRRTTASAWMSGFHTALQVYETTMDNPAFSDLRPVMALHPDPDRVPLPGETDPDGKFSSHPLYSRPDPDYDPAFPDNRDPSWRPGASFYFATQWGQGEVSFIPEAGVTYYIVTGTYKDNTFGLVRLSLWQNPNDNFAEATVLEGTDISLQTANFAATFEEGEPYHFVTSNGGVNHLANPGGRTLWYEWTCPEDGIYVMDTFHSYLNWDDFPAPVPASSNPRSQNFGGNMMLSVYTGNSLSTLERINCNSVMSANTDRNAMLSLQCSAGTTYRIALDTHSFIYPLRYPWSGYKHEWGQRAVIRFNLRKGSLVNDQLADAKIFTDMPHHEFVDLKFASFEPAEPVHAGRDGRSAWWKWTATESGTFFVATASDFYDSQNCDAGQHHGGAVAVYSGPPDNPAFGNLQKVAEANPDGEPGNYLPAVAMFNAVAGQTYYMALAIKEPFHSFDVGGFRSGFHFGKAPVNDEFANATEIIGSRAAVVGHNVGATEEPGEPRIQPVWYQDGSSNSSVWWKWTAPASGTTTISTYGSYIVNELGVYTGAAVGSLSQVVAEHTDMHVDNFNSYEERMDGATREVSFNAEAGMTYHIMVNGGGWDRNAQGPISLSIEGQPGVPFAPSDFVWQRINTSRVDLSWTDNAVDESSYRIERSMTPEGPWQEAFNSGQADTTSFSDLNAERGFYYRIRAEGEGGVSEWVNLPLQFESALEKWRYQHFGSAVETAQSALAANPDGDAYSNFVEFALGGDPRGIDDESLWPVLTRVELDDDLYLAIRYNRLKGQLSGDPGTVCSVAGVTYGHLISGALSGEEWLAREGLLVEESTTPNGWQYERITLRFQTPLKDLGNILLQLHLTQEP